MLVQCRRPSLASSRTFNQLASQSLVTGCVQEVLFCNGVGRRSGNGQLRELRGARPPPAPGALYRLRQPFQVQARINRCGTDSTTG